MKVHKRCTLQYAINVCFQLPRPGSQLENILSSSLLVSFFKKVCQAGYDGPWSGHILVQKGDIPWVWLRVRNSTASSSVFLSLCVSAAAEVHTAKSWSWFCKNGACAPKFFRQIFKPYLKSEVNPSQSSLLDCRYLVAF